MMYHVGGKMFHTVLLIAFSLSLPQTGVISGDEIVFNEFMPDPVASTTESDGEWIELYNRSDSYVNLGGWEIENEDGERIVLQTYLLPPGGYYVIGACSDIQKNGGYEPDCIWSNFSIDNSGEFSLYDNSKTLVDEVTYTEGEWSITSGCSCERINPGWVSSLPSTWDFCTSVYGNGDLGSPGEINSVYENSFAQNSWAFIKAFVN